MSSAPPTCGTACGHAFSGRSTARNAPAVTLKSSTPCLPELPARVPKCSTAPSPNPSNVPALNVTETRELPLAKILVMIPSGEVYNHDCVRWYRYQEIQRSIDHYHNIGDAFVFD